MPSPGVSQRRVCKKCGRKFSVPSSSRRLSCTRCSPERRPATGAPEGVPLADPLHVVGEVERALRSELERAGRVDRYQAVLALRLARQLDANTSAPGAQGLASQIDSLMQRALDGVPPAPDFVDDMASRRKARVSG